MNMLASNPGLKTKGNQYELFGLTGHALTVLSFGGGQDSTVLLEKLIDDSTFRQTYAPGDLLVVMSDTGDEFDSTYEHIGYCQKRCVEAGIDYIDHCRHGLPLRKLEVLAPFLPNQGNYWKQRFLKLVQTA